MSITDFIRTAKSRIGGQYVITYDNGKTAIRKLSKVSSRGELVSDDGIYGAELTSKNCDWDGRKLKVYIPRSYWDDNLNQYVPDWNNRELRYTVEFID